MDPDYYRAVIKVFVDLFNKKMIYRGARMINWDPAAKTALSDEEVEYREVDGFLYHVNYEVVDKAGNPLTGIAPVTIATQRPETIMGDTGLCVNPADERYSNLKGLFVDLTRDRPRRRRVGIGVGVRREQILMRAGRYAHGPRVPHVGVHRLERQIVVEHHDAAVAAIADVDIPLRVSGD